MPRTYASLESRNADLASDFGLEWATKLFGEEAIASLPVRASGKNKGKPKGFVIWRKARTGGYCREFGTALAAGQLADAWIGAGAMTLRGSAVSGQWLGRVQNLAATASAGYFFEQGRARETAERARRDAEWEAEKQELIAERQQSEFEGFCRNASDRQLQGIYDKEMAANRKADANIALAEASRRGVELYK